ncbi:uncharacterized protein [Euphorbia lathyris]|uniref:uncharacterized protein n=1 Tax=Euphorbia lathyris TaxID=212925 RepID=UPI0033139658
MHSLQSPLTGDHKLHQKSGRTPLQPKNSPAIPLTEIQILKPKPKLKQQELIVAESNKENNPIHTTNTPSKLIIDLLDTSLEEELSAIRKKLERLKAEKEKAEKMLNERNRILDLKMKEMEQRGEIQKSLEIEVDRLYRLKELQSSSSTTTTMRISPLRSLREKEHEKKICEEMKGSKEMEESVSAQSPCMSSCSSSKSISSQLVTVK